MTFQASTTTGWTPEQTNTQLPAGDTLPEQVNTSATAPGLGQTVYFDASGNVAGNDGTVPGLLSAGVIYPEKQAPISTVAGGGFANVHQGIGGGVPSSTVAGDTFAAGDRQVIVYDAGNGIAGKKSNSGGNDRSIMGLGRGLRADGTIRIWAGPEGSLMARALMMAQNNRAGAIAYPADATASTDIGSLTVSTSALMLVRDKLRGIITSIEIIPSATQAITSGNDRTITFYKIDTLGVNADVIVARFASTTAMAAPNAANCLTAHLVSFATLVAGTLVMRETDILAYSTVHAGSGVAFPQMAIRANMGAI